MSLTVDHPRRKSNISILSVCASLGLFAIPAVGSESDHDNRIELNQLHIETQTEDLEQEIARLRTLLREAETQNENLLTSIDRLQSRVDELVFENMYLQSQRDDITAQLGVAISEVEALQRVIDVSREEFANVRNRVSGIAQRTLLRTAQGATAGLAVSTGEAIPFYGVGIIVAATTYDLALSCLTMRDMNELNLALGIADDDQETLRVCGLAVPTRDELWQGLVTSPELAWRKSTDGLSALGELISHTELPQFPVYLIPELPDPDFGGVWQRAIGVWEWADRGWIYTRETVGDLFGWSSETD